MDDQHQRRDRILLVDDSPIILALIEESLVQHGYEVVAVDSAREAVARGTGADPAFQLIILDICMPEMTGYEVAEVLRAHPASRETPILLLTSLDSEEDKLRGLEAGGDDFLTKETSEAELLARVRSLIALGQLRAEVKIQARTLARVLTSEPAPGQGAPELTRILVAHHDDACRAELTSALSGEGQRTREASSAEQLLAAIREHRIDIVLASYALLDPSAGDLLQLLQNSEPPPSVLAIDTEPSLTRRLAAFSAGVEDYIVEGISAEELRARLANVKRRLRRHRAERSRIQALLEELLVKDAAIETSLSAIAITDVDGALIHANRSFLEQWRFEQADEAIGRTIDELLLERGGGDLSAELRRTGKWFGELTAIRQDGTRFELQAAINRITNRAGHPVGMMASCVDITELKALQQQVIHAERLAALGVVAGGVGHELRNPLAAIKNTAYFLSMALEEGAPEVDEALQILHQEVEASERIIRGLLDFANPKAPSWQEVDVNAAVLGALARSKVGQDVEVRTDLAQDLLPVITDPDQLARIFSNIIENALQAMPDGGELRVETGDRFAPTEQVQISFTDTGAGIAADQLENIFTPLYTTKPKGIGLGLALSMTLARANEGTIEVESEAGRGSTFRVVLPRSRAAAAGAPEQRPG